MGPTGSITFGLKGPNFCTVSACASGAHAIGESLAVAARRPTPDVILAGGAESHDHAHGVAGLRNMRALSTRTTTPARERPFRRRTDGFVIGEEPECSSWRQAHAKAAGATPICEAGRLRCSGDASI